MNSLCELDHPHYRFHRPTRHLLLTQPHFYRIRFPYRTTGFCTAISQCLEEVKKVPRPNVSCAALTPLLPLASCSSSGLRLYVDLFDGGRAILALAPSLDDDRTLLRESVYGIGGIHTDFVPISGYHWRGCASLNPNPHPTSDLTFAPLTGVSAIGRAVGDKSDLTRGCFLGL